jgi:hypothetical protein
LTHYTRACINHSLHTAHTATSLTSQPDRGGIHLTNPSLLRQVDWRSLCFLRRLKHESGGRHQLCATMLGRARRVVADAAASLLQWAPPRSAAASAFEGATSVAAERGHAAGADGGPRPPPPPRPRGVMYVTCEKQPEFAHVATLLSSSSSSSGARGRVGPGDGAAAAEGGGGDAAVASGNQHEPLALDTEFTSFPSYRPALELVQVAGYGWAEESGAGAACIDCAALRPEAVASLLAPAAAERELVVHDGRTDLRLLRDIGLDTRYVFDTQLAAGFTRCGGRIGLGDLVNQVILFSQRLSFFMRCKKFVCTHFF